MSTSPTLISWRRKSSERKDSSSNFSSAPDGPYDITPIIYISSYPPQLEPIKLVRSQSEQVGQVAHTRKNIIAKHLNQDVSLVAPQIQFDRLRGARKIVDHQHGFFAQSPQISQDSVIGGIEKFNRSSAKHSVRSANRYDALHPVEERVLAFFLGRYVHRRVAVYRILNQRSVQALRLRYRKARVPSTIPLHRCPNSVAVSQENIVSHSDFVAVINDRSPRQRHQHPVHQFDPAAIVVQQGSEPPSNAEVQPHGLAGGVHVIHVVAFHVGHHLQGQFIMVAQEQGPLAGRRDFRSLLQDFGDWFSVFQLQSHEHPGHQRKMKRHMELVSGPEVWSKIGGPLVGLGQQHSAAELFVEFSTQRFQNFVCLRQVLAICALTFHQVRHRIEPEGIHSHVQPELHY